MASSESEAQSRRRRSSGKGTPFGKLPTGARFTYNGRKYLKLEMNLAENDTGNRSIFGSAMEVEIEKDGQEPLADLTNPPR